MTTGFQIILTFMNGLGLMALISVIYGHVERLHVTPLAVSALQGVVFGFGAAVAMLSPIPLGQGLILDAHVIFIGFAAAFGGVPALVVATVLAVAARIGLGGLGGHGLAVALVGMCIAGGAGLLWTRAVRTQFASAAFSLAALGLMVSSAIFSNFVLPFDVAMAIVTVLGPLLLVTNILAAFVLGAFIERERQLMMRETRLKLEAETDPLTGLLNRRSFEHLLERTCRASDSARGVALLVVDIDRFKLVNDTYGHAAGDAVIKGTAKMLLGAIRRGDIAARIGGEEFVVLLPDTSPEDALRVAERIRVFAEATAQQFEDMQIPVTLSVGGHWVREPTTSPQMFRQADAALYTSKQTGRNRVTFTGNPLVADQAA